MSRPLHYSDEQREAIIEQVCELLEAGTALTRICRETKGIPAIQTIYYWERKYPEIAEALSKAREHGSDTLIDMGRERLETSSPQTICVDREVANYYKWMAAKLAQRKYGEKIVNEQHGPVVVTWETEKTE